MTSPHRGADSESDQTPSFYSTVTREGPTTTTTTTVTHTLQVPGSPVSRQLSNGRRNLAPPSSRPILQNRPSTIRIRRIPSSPAPAQEEPVNYNYGRASPIGGSGRRRSASEPQPMQLPPPIHTSGDYGGPQANYMSPVQEETTHTIPEHPEPHQQADHLAPATANTGRLRSASNATRKGLKRMSSRLSTPSQAPQKENEYETEVTDLLDVVGEKHTFRIA